MSRPISLPDSLPNVGAGNERVAGREMSGHGNATAASEALALAVATERLAMAVEAQLAASRLVRVLRADLEKVLEGW